VPETPRLFRVVLQVADVDRAVAFYERLLGIPGTRVAPGRHYFHCEGVILGILDPKSEGHVAKPIPDHVYFAVPDLGAIHAVARELRCLSSGKVHGEPAGEIVKRPWGERSFYADDPFGNKLCFVDSSTLFTGLD